MADRFQFAIAGDTLRITDASTGVVTELDIRQAVGQTRGEEPRTEASKFVDDLLAVYIRWRGCGDEPACTTCCVGVAVGIQSLDDAFNAGYKVAKSEGK